LNPDLIYTLIIVGGALLWPIVKLLTQSVYTRFEQKLPANVQALLEQYAAMAVRAAEQQLGGRRGMSKKELAGTTIQALLRSAELPEADDDMLNAAIENAVWLMKQQQKS
jgi:LL-H family phage holin